MKADSNNFKYDDSKHEYTVDGILQTYISEMLSPYNKFLPIPKNILQDDESWIDQIRPRLRIVRNKTAWGKTVHDYLEILDNDQLDIEAIPKAADGAPDIRAVVENWAQICHDELYPFLAIEKPLYSNQYRFAGTADRITTKEPIEIKTSLPRKATGVQLAFQAQLALENGYIKELPEKLHSWHVTERGKWTQKEYDFKECWNIAMCLLTAHNHFNRG